MAEMHGPVSVFWFRRDLRVEDNHGLLHAARAGTTLLPLFIFDREILDRLPVHDARVEFIHAAIRQLNSDLNGRLQVLIGKPKEVFARLLSQHNISAVFTNEDYEPYARSRDKQVADFLKTKSVSFHSFKDQVIFSPEEVLKDDGSSYRVFTAYARRWMARLAEHSPEVYASKRALKKVQILKPRSDIPSLKDLGFKPSRIEFPKREIKKSVLKNYAKHRDLLGEIGTSSLGVHLRFGTLSVRKLLASARPMSDVFVKELIWREFFMQILFHFPHTETEPFDPRYARIKWVNNKKQFKKWCEGQTGYPVVDAGMRELNTTGRMHNRARMIAASFLTKHLLIDWRWGERYFAEKLLDFDLSANVGNWQWVAGSGCDAAPYFRVFNPTLQQKKFDPQNKYVNLWVPEWKTASYPKPIVDHEFASRRAVKVYSEAIKGRL